MSPAPAPIDCSQAEILIDRLCTGGIPGPVAIVLRRHLAGCPDCKGRYREAVQSTADLAKVVRQRPNLASRARETASDRRMYRRRRTALLFVVASFLIAMVARLDGDWSFDPTMAFECSAGEAWVGGQLVNPSHPRVQVLRSDLIRTESDGRGLLRMRSLECEVEPGTELLVISAVAQRVRLRHGSLVLRGDGLLETPRGLIEVEEGVATVHVDERALRVEATSGVVRRIDARGTRTLATNDTESRADAG
ncbi:MAG: hypothetical protein AAFZ65_14940 [Planctomycetota bacterium]